MDERETNDLGMARTDAREARLLLESADEALQRGDVTEAERYLDEAAKWITNATMWLHNPRQAEAICRSTE